MSADSISVCPVCYIEEHPDKVLADVTVEELDDESVTNQLREYYGFYIDRGHVVADYSANCRDCGYRIEFRHEHPLPEVL